MDLIGNLGLGFATALSPENIFFCFVGVLLGTLVGVLPGIGPTATIAMLLPITFTLEPVTALIMLAGIYYGAQYGGSTTAILINLPGESSSAVTAIDGHEMARQGRAGPALAAAALGSFFAGTVATLVVVLFAPLLANIALGFGSAEFFSLVVLGLIASITLARGSTIKALAMIVLGLPARHGRPGHLHRHAALHLRLPGALLRDQLRVGGGRHVRRGRDPAKPGEREDARPSSRKPSRTLWLDAGGSSRGSSDRCCAGPCSARRSASCPGAVMSSRRSRPIRSRSASRATPRHSGMARSRAWPGRNRPTTPQPRPPSSRC